MKHIQYLKLVIIITIFIPGISYCQDLTYRSDGIVLNINILSVKDGTMIYRPAGDNAGKIFYLSTGMVDSVVYRNGCSEIFIHEDRVPETIRRNYIGVDFVETFIRWLGDFHVGLNNLHLSYEHISRSGRTGLAAELLWSIDAVNETSWAEEWGGHWIFYNEGWRLSYDPFRFFVKVGVNTYPFNYSLIKTGSLRFSTGASLFLGKIRRYDWSIDYWENQIKEVVIAGIIWNVDLKIYLADALQVRLGLDASVIPFLVFICPELGITLSF
ncbi:MAG: hypothetical protein RQ743_03660 [Bacteroidales bacterium]|nr:hypothetical protein [Bacteroidales bacterium]